MGISLRAYARHRGVSLAAVQKAISSGRIHREDDGSIDSDRADLEWEANTRPPHEGETLEEAGLTYRKARKMRLLYEAKLAKLELDEREGIVADAGELCRDVFLRARQVRDRLMTVPRRLGPMCAAEKDPAVIAELLREALTDALDTMASADRYVPLGAMHG